MDVFYMYLDSKNKTSLMFCLHSITSDENCLNCFHRRSSNIFECSKHWTEAWKSLELCCLKGGFFHGSGALAVAHRSGDIRRKLSLTELYVWPQGCDPLRGIRHSENDRKLSVIVRIMSWSSEPWVICYFSQSFIQCRLTVYFVPVRPTHSYNPLSLHID